MPWLSEQKQISTLKCVNPFSCNTWLPQLELRPWQVKRVPDMYSCSSLGRWWDRGRWYREGTRGGEIESSGVSFTNFTERFNIWTCWAGRHPCLWCSASGHSPSLYLPAPVSMAVWLGWGITVFLPKDPLKIRNVRDQSGQPAGHLFLMNHLTVF